MRSRAPIGSGDPVTTGTTGVAVDRWSVGTVLVGVILAAIHAVHAYEMRYFGSVGVIVEGIVPFVLAGILAATGPWLSYRGFDPTERRRVFKWMVVFGTLVGLVFLWSLSHQSVIGYSFPHAEYVTTTNITAGAGLGIVVGLFEVRTHRHYRTVERQRERADLQRSRLSVLNRILRHNIRNDTNIVHGICRDIADETEASISDRASTAAEVVEDLHGLSEKARRIDEALEDDRPRRTIDTAAFLEEIMSPYRRETEAIDLEVVVGERVGRLTVQASLLRRIIDELLENAISHGDGTLTRVSVGANRTDDGGVAIVVEDDGPGIPSIEQESVNLGIERDMEHASGIGLWFAKWGTELLGGELSIDSGDASPTRVTVELPASVLA